MSDTGSDANTVNTTDRLFRTVCRSLRVIGAERQPLHRISHERGALLLRSCTPGQSVEDCPLLSHGH